MAVELEIRGLDKLQAQLERYPATSEKHINAAISRSLVRILGEEKRQAPVHTGNLRDNWRLDVTRFAGRLASNAPYASALHFGTPLTQFPTANALKAWAAKKGLNPYAVAKAIKKRGHLIANPFFQRAVDMQSDLVNREFAEALNAILKDISAK